MGLSFEIKRISAPFWEFELIQTFLDLNVVFLWIVSLLFDFSLVDNQECYSFDKIFRFYFLNSLAILPIPFYL